jgi:hypothetical protein
LCWRKSQRNEHDEKADEAPVEGPQRQPGTQYAVYRGSGRRDLQSARERLRQICKSEHLPSKVTVLQWALDTMHPFSARYARARELGYTLLGEELLEISDNSSGDLVDGRIDQGVVARDRLRVDTRKWVLSGLGRQLGSGHESDYYAR